MRLTATTQPDPPRTSLEKCQRRMPISIKLLQLSGVASLVLCSLGPSVADGGVHFRRTRTRCCIPRYSYGHNEVRAVAQVVSQPAVTDTVPFVVQPHASTVPLEEVRDDKAKIVIMDEESSAAVVTDRASLDPGGAARDSVAVVLDRAVDDLRRVIDTDGLGE